MTITWLGHACFLLEEDGFRAVLDPYTNVPGYPELETSAHAVYCSHHHFDHDAVDRVATLPAREDPFTVREVSAFHDDRGGALRGRNVIRIFTGARGLSVAHLGDLGHQLSPEQRKAVGSVDCVLVPVGGVYTLDAAGAKAVCDALSPRWIVPMHYRDGVRGLRDVSGVEGFLSLFPPERVHRAKGASLDLAGLAEGVWVPRSANALEPV